MADSNNAPLSRADVVSEVSAQVDLPASQVETVIRAFEGSLQRALVSGTEVRMLGFGTFKQSSRAARPGRNPSTGAAIKIAASKGVSFKAGKALKDAVNGGGKKGGAKATPAGKSGSADAKLKAISKIVGGSKAAPAKAAAPAAKTPATKSGGAKTSTTSTAGISKSVAGKVLATDSKGGAKSGAKGGKKK